jgi:phosphoribosyl 1,2-cyclic phosphodiesterase
MRVIVLGSGSTGNATLVEADGERVLVDAGFSGRDIERRLETCDIPPESVTGILITHEHADHTRGVGVLARRFGLPVHISEGTLRACAPLFRGDEEIRIYAGVRPFRIGALEVHPFLTVHDAIDPIAVTLVHERTGLKLGVATDLGRPTAAVRASLASCDLLVLEANHDEALLWTGPYPWSVKQRIASSHGHLSNNAAAHLACELNHPGLGCVILAHLSEHCNDGALACDTVGAALARAGYDGDLLLAAQTEPLEPIDVVALRDRRRPVQLSLL